MGYIGNDPELMAITTCTELLESLTIEQRLRVMAMLGSRFGSQSEASSMQAVYRTSPIVRQDGLLLASIPLDKHSTPDDSSNGQENFPTFYSVYSKDVHQSEAEVLLLMGLYLLQSEKNNFTKDDVLQYYRDQEIFTESRRNNLSHNLNSLVRSKYLEAVAKGSYRITKNGKEKAFEIISREDNPKSVSKKSSASVKKTNGAVNKPKKSSGTVAFLPDLNLYPDDEISLEDFYNQFVISNNYENNLIFVYYLTEKLKVEKIGLAEISTCYKTLGLEIPNVSQSIADTSRRKTWLMASDKSDIKLHRNGENYLNSKMKRKES